MANLAVTPSSPTPPARGHTLPLKSVLPLLLILTIAGVTWRYGFQPQGDPVLMVSGRIEGYDTDLGAKVGGRIAEISVREGDPVQPGQVVARLEDEEVQAQVRTAQARVKAAQEQVQTARLQVQVVESQIQEVSLNLTQSQGDAAGRVYQAQALVASAQAQLAQAQAQVQEAAVALVLAQNDRDRFAALVGEGAVSQQQFDEKRTRFDSAQETLKARQAAAVAAQEQVRAAQGALTQSQTNTLNPEIRTVQLDRLQTQKQQAQAQLASAEADLGQAQAALAEVAARLATLTSVTPIGGGVVSRSAEPGEVVATGKTLLTVVNLQEVYLRGYIPEGEVGAIQVGQAAQVFLDSDPDHPLKAKVAAVDTEASFTPENIYFKADRVTQVFGLNLAIENPDGYAKPGMPADAQLDRSHGNQEGQP